MKEAFREALIRHIKVYDVSIAEVARGSGVSKYLLNALHQRKTTVPNVSDAIKVARFFGKTVEEFLDQPGRATDAERIMAKMARLSPEEREVLEAQIDVLARRRK
jgi:transcriptional regulator with XRE-family HTH domain